MDHRQDSAATGQREQEASALTTSFALKRVPFLEVDVYPVDIDVYESVEVANSLSDQ